MLFRSWCVINSPSKYFVQIQGRINIYLKTVRNFAASEGQHIHNAAVCTLPMLHVFQFYIKKQRLYFLLRRKHGPKLVKNGDLDLSGQKHTR